MSDKEKDLVYDTEDLVWIDRLLSDEYKAKIEALLSNEEFLTLMEAKHGSFNNWYGVIRQ